MELTRASSSPIGVMPGVVRKYSKGPPATLQTHKVRMNFKPGSLPNCLVCRSRKVRFLEA
jgi:hypothetical protein